MISLTDARYVYITKKKKLVRCQLGEILSVFVLSRRPVLHIWIDDS